MSMIWKKRRGYTYCRKGDIETAQKYAKMAPIYHVTVNQMMPHLLNGKEAVKYCQTNIQTLMDLIMGNVNVLINKGNYSPEEAIEARSFAIDCFKLLYPDGNYGFYHCRLSTFYQSKWHVLLLFQNTISLPHFCQA